MPIKPGIVYSVSSLQISYALENHISAITENSREEEDIMLQ